MLKHRSNRPNKDSEFKYGFHFLICIGLMKILFLGHFQSQINDLAFFWEGEIQIPELNLIEYFFRLYGLDFKFAMYCHGITP